MEKEKYLEVLIKLIVNNWRFVKNYELLITKINPEERNNFLSKLNWYKKNLEESLNEVEIKLVSLENKKYDPGIAATALNIEDFDNNDNLIVEQMIEPIVMGSNGVIKNGLVLLKRIST